MVVGDQHRHAQAAGFLDAGVGGDAVVHGDEQVRFALGGDADDFRRKAVAVFETVRHQILHPGAQGGKTGHGDGAGGGAVGVVVGHHQHFFLAGDGVGEANAGRVGIQQRAHRQQFRQFRFHFTGRLDAARRAQTRQQRGHAGLAQSLEGIFPVGSDGEIQHVQIFAGAGWMPH